MHYKIIYLLSLIFFFGVKGLPTKNGEIEEIQEIVYNINVTAEGYITSPNYPNLYSNNLRVVYHIHSPDWQYTDLEVLDFQLENGYDYLTVFDGPTENSPIVGRYTGTNIPSDIYMGQNYVTLLFTTDGSVQDRGFRIRHYPCCGGGISTELPTE